MGRGLWYRPQGDEYKVSVTGFTFSVMWYDKHSADWLAALASPYPAAPDFPLCREQNKSPLCCELLMKGLLCGPLLSHRSAGGRWCRKAPKGENAFPRPKGRSYGFSRQRRHKKWRPKGRRTSPAGTVSQPIGKPFNGQAKGQLRPTCTSYAGCAHQPSGILESTAQVPVPIPVPTAPQAPEPSSSKGACPSYKKTGTLCVGFLIASLIVLISERKAARWQCRGRSRGGRFPGS